MSNILDRVYERSPIFIQNVMATGYGLRQRAVRNRGQYGQFVDELEQRQWWDEARLREHQDASLRAMVEFASKEVPYYRDLFASARLRAADIRTAADLCALPFLDKATVQEQGDRLRPDRVSTASLAQTTGGTTGRPVPYWVTPSSIQFNYATFETRCRRWAGVKFGDRLVSLNGKPIVPMTQRGAPFWRHNLAFNQLYVSAYHLSDENLPAIVDRIAKFGPVMIVAYVSAVHRIARFMLDANREREVRPRAILVSSETLFDWQRADIERAFGCKVFNGYSLGEPVCFISECSEGGMHISPEYGVVEYIESEGAHEIVATGLINRAMPMLRYRTGDRGVPGDGSTCACGRGLPKVGAIAGRIDEMVVTPEGSTVGPASLSLAFQSVPNLRESQIVQDTADRIAVYLAVASAYVPANEAFLLRELRKRLGNKLAIDLHYVDAVPRTVSGKQRLVVSNLGSRP